MSHCPTSPCDFQNLGVPGEEGEGQVSKSKYYDFLHSQQKIYS